MSDESRAIIDRLARMYPDARCGLEYASPYELLVATILSAQTTDVRVNEVTKLLFERVKTPAEMVEISQDELETIIEPCGIYRNKAANLKKTSRLLLERFGGRIPRDIDALTSLPGVGRKTANIVMSTAYGIPAIAVDTHVFRLANRLGLSDDKTAEQVERDLMVKVPVEEWVNLHHRLIAHGRQVCEAKKPKCSTCQLFDLCPWTGKKL